MVSCFLLNSALLKSPNKQSPTGDTGAFVVRSGLDGGNSFVHEHLFIYLFIYRLLPLRKRQAVPSLLFSFNYSEEIKCSIFFPNLRQKALLIFFFFFWTFFAFFN